RVGAERLGRLHAILVDHPERAEPHVPRVVVRGKGEGVIGVEPAVIEVSALGAGPDRDHGALMIAPRARTIRTSARAPMLAAGSPATARRSAAEPSAAPPTPPPRPDPPPAPTAAAGVPPRRRDPVLRID